MTDFSIPCPLIHATTFNLAQCPGLLEGRPGTVLGQSWLTQHESDFRPATVWAFQTDSFLGVYARLQDEDIGNSARTENMRTWETGDVLEIFLRPQPGLRYLEFHVTPENQRLQLSFESEAYARARPDSIGKHPVRWLEGIGLPAGSFESEALVRTEYKEWRVLARIPLALFGRADGIPAGEQWLVSFCRYDYTRGRNLPVLSTTSSHAEADFHDNAGWHPLQFT